MKFLLFFFLLFFSCMQAQVLQKPSAAEIKSLQAWAKEMYADQPNAKKVINLFTEYYKNHPFEKNYHTQYYKRWRRKIQNTIQPDGSIHLPNHEEIEKRQQDYILKNQNKAGKTNQSLWTVAGPIQVWQNNGIEGNGQCNIYSLDQHPIQTQILYCGTEPGEVFKSTDAGNHWSCVSLDVNFGSGVTAVKMDPLNENIVYAGGNAGLFRSNDAGQTWTKILNVQTQINEILVLPIQTTVVFVATDNGFYRYDGANWSQIFTEKCYDIKAKPFHQTTLYLVKNNPTTNICEFFSSSDFGINWTKQSNGWYQSSDPDRNDGGARLAVSPADSNVVYAYLIGEAKANDYGFIGVYRSLDGGNSWILPNGPAGGPYTTAHPNLAIGGNGWNYHQGFYNCAIMASDTNANVILVGGLNLFKSIDGGQTFTGIAGYIGGNLDMHVDNQDFRIINGKSWITTDGGIYYSEDFFSSQPSFKMNGIRASDFWGFGSGWNEDVLTGGLYHNGNIAYHENYGLGNYLDLGGGEAPTGYVNPGNNRKTYFSDIGGRILPLSITDPIGTAAFGKSPNETYYAVESSEMEFHPNCYNMAYIGNENKLWKTTDGGASFNAIYTFGTNPDEQIKYIEISSSNPEVIYLTQQSNVSWSGKVWKTTNGGINWTNLNIPNGNNRRISLALNPSNENEIWMSYAEGSNGNKIYYSSNGGQSWSNLSTNMLDNESIQSLCMIAGTNGGMYVCTDRAVYYRNHNMTDWQLENNGLPLYFNSNIARPFYRDGKIRIASYGKGIWESALVENPDTVVARITVDKLSQQYICSIDSFYFNDYSFINHQNASWNWTFQNGSPANATIKNPVVHFPNGTHLVTLTITDAQGKTDMDSIYVTVNQAVLPVSMSEGFEGNFPPNAWAQSENGRWNQELQAGGFGTTLKSAVFNNYDIDAAGAYDDLFFTLDASQLNQPMLSFDLAHAYYGGQYNDSLEVLVSTDCGQTFQSLYLKGGNDLATAPNQTTLFIPNASQWRKDSIDLSAFAGQSKLIVVFRNIGRFGNCTYLDNILLNNTLSSNTLENTSDIHIYPNPISQGQCLNLQLPNENCQVQLINLNGKKVWSSTLKGDSSIPMDFSSGVYILNIRTNNKIWNKKMIVK